MPRTRPPYPPGFRRRSWSWCGPGVRCARLLKSSAPDETIREWVRQANRDEEVDLSGPTTGEKEELCRLRRENRQRRAM